MSSIQKDFATRISSQTSFLIRHPTSNCSTLWFHTLGSFQKIENADLYVEFALRAIELFPAVTNWWSFNELGIKAFQQARESFPTDLPEGSSLSQRVHAAGNATRTMLIAHCKLHEAVERLHPSKKVGVTHQWLKFDTATGNCLEKVCAYFFTKFSFSPIYRFFKKGEYSFQFPFMANIQFKIPKQEFDDNNHFLTQLGVQVYPKAMLKMGFNGGKTYPGDVNAIQNFRFLSFGASCEPGGTVTRLGPRWKAEGIDEALDEAFALTDQVWITEFGSDARIQRWGDPDFAFDDAAQAQYLEQLTQRIHNYSIENSKQIQGVFCWSDLRRQMEWDNGHECRMALIDTIVDENRRLVDWGETPASRHLAEFYRQEEAQQDGRIA
ncbi:MAG: family 1 glycosylhydrolase [Chlamydiales bacterium]|nr:family 1 glycosylhydrolase [Chlamydiales bacterium]